MHQHRAGASHSKRISQHQTPHRCRWPRNRNFSLTSIFFSLKRTNSGDQRDFGKAYRDLLYAPITYLKNISRLNCHPVTTYADDLEAWLYMVLELFCNDELPWANSRLDEMLELKKQFMEGKLQPYQWPLKNFFDQMIQIISTMQKDDNLGGDFSGHDELRKVIRQRERDQKGDDEKRLFYSLFMLFPHDQIGMFSLLTLSVQESTPRSKGGIGPDFCTIVRSEPSPGFCNYLDNFFPISKAWIWHKIFNGGFRIHTNLLFRKKQNSLNEKKA